MVATEVHTSEKILPECVRLAKSSQIADEVAEKEQQRQLDEKADNILLGLGFFRDIKCRPLTKYEKEQRLLYDFDSSDR